ncbi:MAG: hypothetical protein M5T61_19865 [Acidimicrobiia bacterium]|nr:hypothetical protein [Acidimicrobiia bacterium]
MKRLFDLEAMEPLDDAALHALEEAMRESEEEPHDNDAIAAGYTYLGQFIDHDITHASTPTHGTQAFEAREGPRSPQLDLDLPVRRRPRRLADLYEPTNEKLFRWENRNSTTHDLLRDAEGIAIAADPRNDENVIIGQLTLSLLKLHNKIVADLPDDATLRGGSETRSVALPMDRRRGLPSCGYRSRRIHKSLQLGKREGPDQALPLPA